MTQQMEDRQNRQATEAARDRRFVASLDGLVPRTDRGEERRGDRAALAALRRASGRGAGESIDAYPTVYRALGDTSLPPWEEGPYFIVASLFAFYPESARGDAGDQSQRSRSLGNSFAQLSLKSESGRIEKRFSALLDSRRDNLPEHLRHAVSLMRAHEVAIDWVRLLGDIRLWDGDDRRVQRRWARDFWGHLALVERDATAGTPVEDNDMNKEDKQ